MEVRTRRAPIFLTVITAFALLFFSGCAPKFNSPGLLAASGAAHVQSLFQWVVEDGSSKAPAASVIGEATVVDSSGDVYISGTTSTGLDGQTLHDLTLNGTDFFISKYNSVGTLLWTVQDGAIGAQSAGAAIALDPSGDVFVAGYTSAAIDGEALHGTRDFFITKYNSNGVHQWTVEDGVPGGSAIADGIAVDSGGNVYATGTTTKAIDGQALHGSVDFFITKYNAAGTWQWTVEDGGGSTSARGVAVDSGGNVYATGSTTAAIDGQTLHGTQDFFITKYNSSGAWQWTVEDGAASAIASSYGIAVDASGNVYATGSTKNAIDCHDIHGRHELFITK